MIALVIQICPSCEKSSRPLDLNLAIEIKLCGDCHAALEKERL